MDEESRREEEVVSVWLLRSCYTTAQYGQGMRHAVHVVGGTRLSRCHLLLLGERSNERE
jgi:hypothetical protein